MFITTNHTRYKAELARIKAAFKASAEADVAALREAVYGYKEQIERLEVQKKLLVEQVLQLEMGLEDAEERAAGLEVELARAAAERDAARVEASQAQAAAAAASARAAAAVAAQQQAAAAAAASSSPGGGAAALHMPHAHLASGLVDAGDDGGWADAPTAEALLPRITELWDALFVPLAYRSRFYLAFRGREVFYYEVRVCSSAHVCICV